MRKFALLFLFVTAISAVTGQETVYFFAGDGLKVRGDVYLKNNKLPFIILCHQDGSNRSEYYEVAPRLLNLNYNCLAIDLRAEGKSLDAEADIIAAIRYVTEISNPPIILLGSSYSASLCLLIAAVNPQVKAVIALNPGEYFQPFKIVAKELQKINRQVFISATQADYPYLQKMVAGIPPECLTIFKPEKGKAIRGAGAFYSSNENNGEYWFALMMLFKKLG
jgi:pimeloyl-ACP methyl ester carboxylesterase